VFRYCPGIAAGPGVPAVGTRVTEEATWRPFRSGQRGALVCHLPAKREAGQVTRRVERKLQMPGEDSERRYDRVGAGRNAADASEVGTQAAIRVKGPGARGRAGIRASDQLSYRISKAKQSEVAIRSLDRAAPGSTCRGAIASWKCHADLLCHVERCLSPLSPPEVPHPQSLSPGPNTLASWPSDTIEQNLVSIKGPVLRKILHDNAAQLYQL
jgi:hypothetical protein